MKKAPKEQLNASNDSLNASNDSLNASDGSLNASDEKDTLPFFFTESEIICIFAVEKGYNLIFPKPLPRFGTTFVYFCRKNKEIWTTTEDKV
jgi:hypothetical protein